MTTKRNPADAGQQSYRAHFTIDDYLNRLHGVVRSSTGYKALCPAHDDRNPSLSIDAGKNGHPVLHCHAGCSYEAIITALDLDQPDTRPPFSQSTQRKIVATYDYGDEHGILLYQKVRYEPKTFAIRRPDGDGWTWKKGDARPVLYRLPELIKAIATGQATVFITEGEKDADRLHAAGLTATTNIEGAAKEGQRQKWKPEYSDQLAGAHRVVILPDNDPPGRSHAADIAAKLVGRVADIRVLELPGLPEKGDVSDWLNRGHTVDELFNIVESTKPFDQAGKAAPAESDGGSIPMVRHWPELPPEALQGLAGEVVKAATDHSEADPAAVLITFLAWMGATFGYQSGQTPYFHVGDTQHAPRLYAAVVGQTSRARKGTSVGPVKRIMSEAGQSTGVQPCQFCEGPLSSGEGIIYRLRDDSEEVDDKTGEPVTPGARDKRLMVLEGELGSTFKVAERAGNIVSTILRVAWDGGVIEPLTKNARLKSSYPHLVIVGHITHDELRSLLTSIDLRNGLANRFLWVCARRAKTVSLPKPIPKETATQIAAEVAAVIKAATPGPLTWEASTIAIWEKVYPVLTQDRLGAWGYATARAEAQVVRLAMIYALLDKSRVVTPEHLTAACAVWQYCDQSAAHIFGTAEADPTANKILEALAAGELTQTDIQKRVLQGHVKAETIAVTLRALQEAGRVTQRKEGTTGRPIVFWSLSECVKSVKSVKRPGSHEDDNEVPDLIRLIRLIRTEETSHEAEPAAEDVDIPPVQPGRFREEF